MRKGSKEYQVHYKPIPSKGRFWVYSESCYTEEELNLRQWLLKVRANSGIHPDFLINPSSWFTEDSQALINTNEHSWFYANSYKPRHVLSRDDFHVQPIDSQRLQWPALYDLMQKTGDYLLIRNQELSDEHLNQPMNFVLLDVNNMLKALSQNPNINQVKEQLEIITKYLRTIEKNISPLVGSDRLFLANFRGIIDDDIHPQLTHKIESQLLRDRLQDLSKTINKLSTDRNRILHFALNTNPVNPHPYGFSIGLLEDTKSYPTQAAKECGHLSTEVVTEASSPLIVTIDQLKNCPNFKLISMDEEVLSHYSAAISDLNELDRFQKVISQIIDLLGQAGEVYTISQFKEQMLTLLKQINSFIDDSSEHIEDIIHANTLAYHHAIQAEQNLSLLKKLLTSEQTTLKTYIKNQDTLAQFPSSSVDLSKTNKELKEHVSQVIGHLSQTKRLETSFEAIAGQAHELNNLMDSMHNWIKIQYQIKGLEAPKPPEPLQIVAKSVPKQEKVIREMPPLPSVRYGEFFSPKSMTSTPCDPNDPMCMTNETTPSQQQNQALFLGFLVLAPIGIILLYLLIKRMNKEEEPVMGTKKEFNKLKTKVEDLITQISGSEQSDDADLTENYEDILYNYDKLIKKANRGEYDVVALNKVHLDVEALYNDNTTTEQTLETESPR